MLRLAHSSTEEYMIKIRELLHNEGMTTYLQTYVMIRN